MSWLKIDDQIASHHKIVKVGPTAAWLWICSIAYAQNHFTDGFISDAVVEHLGVPSGVKQLASRLLKHKLWDRVKGGYQVHDYLKHNASAAERKAELQDKARAGRKGGQVMQARRRQALNAQAPREAKLQQSGGAAAAAVLQPTPLHSAPLKAGAPTARTADTVGGTNTAGNGSDQPRRDAPDGGPSAPASAPVVPAPLSPELRKRFGIPT